MDLPKSTFETIARGQNKGQLIIVHNDRFYLVDGAYSPSLETNYVKLNNDDRLKFPLIEAERLSKIESLDDIDFNEDLRKWQEQYMDSKDFKTLTTVDIEIQKTRAELYSFIINQVFPAFFDSEFGKLPSFDSLVEKFGDSSALGSASRTGKKKTNGMPNALKESDPLLSLLAKKSKKKEEIAKISSYDIDSSDSILYSQVLKKKSCLFFPPYFVYEFINYNKERDEMVNINGTMYSLKISSNHLQDVLSGYTKAREEIVKAQALENKPAVLAVRDLNAIIDERISSAEYKRANLGIIEHDYHCASVTLHNPQFINTNEDNYYLFPEMTIGIRLTMNNDKSISVEQPRIIENVGHPFLNGVRSNQPICLAGYTPNEITKAAYVIDWLNVSQNVILCAYNSRHNFIPYHSLDYFVSNRISKNEADTLIKSGVAKITNVIKH